MDLMRVLFELLLRWQHGYREHSPGRIIPDIRKFLRTRRRVVDVCRESFPVFITAMQEHLDEVRNIDREGHRSAPVTWISRLVSWLIRTFILSPDCHEMLCHLGAPRV